MYTVEIESEVTPGAWFPVDDPHALYGEAIMTAFALNVRYGVGKHLRVRSATLVA